MFKHVQCSNYYLHFSGCIVVLGLYLQSVLLLDFFTQDYVEQWTCLDMLFVLELPLLPAPQCMLQQRNFRGTFLQLLKSLLMHQTKSTTPRLKTQTMTASEISEDNPKKPSLNKMGALSARSIIFMNPDPDCSGIQSASKSGSPSQPWNADVAYQVWKQQRERDTCTSEFFKKSSCMEHYNPNTHARARGRLKREQTDSYVQCCHFRSWICCTQAALKC